MTHTSATFHHKTESIKEKLLRLIRTLLIFIPLFGFIWGGSWYLDKQIPVWVSDYFNIASAEKLSNITQKRVQLAEQAMAFPIGVSAYVSAQIDSVTAGTKAATLSFAARMTTILLQGILYVLAILMNIYLFFKLLKHYKTDAAEARIARRVVNLLLPVLDEINENIKKTNSPSQ